MVRFAKSCCFGRIHKVDFSVNFCSYYFLIKFTEPKKGSNKDELDRPVRSQNPSGPARRDRITTGAKAQGDTNRRNKHPNDRTDRMPNPSGPAGLGAEHGRKAKHMETQVSKHI